MLNQKGRAKTRPYKYLEMLQTICVDVGQAHHADHHR